MFAHRFSFMTCQLKSYWIIYLASKKKEENCEIRVLDEIMNNDAHAIVHAVIVWVSKVKNAGKRFEGGLTDGLSLMRMVGFEERQLNSK